MKSLPLKYSRAAAPMTWNRLTGLLAQCLRSTRTNDSAEKKHADLQQLIQELDQASATRGTLRGRQ